MASTLQLDIVTPERGVFSGPVTQVTLPAWEGQLGVMPDHDALLALLRGGIATVAAPEGETRYVIGRGFAEIGPTAVILLTDSCERADKVDKQKAAKDLQTLEHELADVNMHNAEAMALQARVELALARIEA